jgi:hypothetical protein
MAKHDRDRLTARRALAFAGLLALAASAGCGGIPRIIEGRPPFHPGLTESYWIWHDGGGWHLRTTTAVAQHRFQGVIYAANGGAITNLAPTRVEWGDRIRVGVNGIEFDFETMGGSDGFDWRVSSGCNTFDLMIDGVRRPGLTHVGAEGYNPGGVPFSRCR